ncbi:hypothetical protein K438DRAFT_1851518, partial [Mycena galopus ATCC 62051]
MICRPHFASFRPRTPAPSQLSLGHKLCLAFCSMSVSVLLGQSPLSFHLIAPRALSITTSPWFMYLRYTFAKGFPLVLPLQLQPHQCPPRVRTIVFLFSKFHSIHFRAAHCPSLPTISIQSSLHPNPNPVCLCCPPSTPRSRCGIASASRSCHSPPLRCLGPCYPHRVRNAKSRRSQLSLAPLGECGCTLRESIHTLVCETRVARRAKSGMDVPASADIWRRSTS